MAFNKTKSLLKFPELEEVESLTEPSIMDKYIKENDPEQWDKIQLAHNLKNAMELSQNVGMAAPKGKWADAVTSRYTEKLPISLLEKFKGNALRPTTDLEALKASIKKEGLNEPLNLTFDPNNKLIKLGEGNHRLEALKQLGYDEAPVWANRGHVNPETTTIKDIPFKPSNDPVLKNYYGAEQTPSDVIDIEQLKKLLGIK